MSRDFTRGYGPEEYMLKSAMPGKYVVSAKYYASHRQDLAGATSVLLNLTYDFGRPEEKSSLTAIRLNENKEKIQVGEFFVEEKLSSQGTSESKADETGEDSAGEVHLAFMDSNGSGDY